MFYIFSYLLGMQAGKRRAAENETDKTDLETLRAGTDKAGDAKGADLEKDQEDDE